MENQLKVGFLCPHDPFDQRTFSGTSYYAFRALEAASGVSLRVLGPFRPKRHRRMFSKWMPRRQLNVQKLDLDGLDAVVGLVATRYIAALLPRGGASFIHVTDSTPSFQRDFYGRDVPAEADAAEALVIRGVDRVVYSSHFMAERACEEFKVPAERCSVVPFGVNLEDLPSRLPTKSPFAPLKLLHVTTDWTRKGGDVVVQVLERLERDGMNVELTVVGAAPAELARHPSVHLTGYLDKNSAAGLARLRKLFSEAHLFLLPTRADCTPMVVAEANAYGTPVLIAETGGVATLMDEGRNGRMLPSVDPDVWVDALHGVIRNREEYTALSASSFAHAHQRLSWSAWARDIVEIVREVREG